VDNLMRPSIGDIFAFELPSGRVAYAHFVALHPEFGTLVHIHQSEQSEMRPIEDIVSIPSPFAPVFVGLYPAVRSGRWKRIGAQPVPPAPFPRFRWTFGTKPGRYTDWRIWDGKHDVFVGELLVADRALELRTVWGAETLEHRIDGKGEWRGDKME
jgi:hypothetical protein